MIRIADTELAQRWGLAAVVAIGLMVVTSSPVNAQVEPRPEPSPAVEDTIVPEQPTTVPAPDETVEEPAKDSVTPQELETEPTVQEPLRPVEGEGFEPRELPQTPDLGGREAVVRLPEITSQLITVQPPAELEQDIVSEGLWVRADSTNQDPSTLGQYDAVRGAATAPIESAHASANPEAILEVLPVTTGRPDLTMLALPRAVPGDQIVVDTFPASDAIPGSAFALTVAMAAPLSTDASWVDIAIDTSGVDHLYGGDYGGRLTIMAFPECVLTMPTKRGCSDGVPLHTYRDDNGVLMATVPADAAPGLRLDGEVGRYGAGMQVGTGVRSGDLVQSVAESQGLRFAGGSGSGTILAAVAGAAGPGGSFAATDLSPIGSWAVGEQSGAFTYSVPVEVPPASFGPAPQVSLDYSSATVDGQTASANPQASIIGDGWSMATSYIERQYKSCADDGMASTKLDLCWYSPYSNAPLQAPYVMSLGGQTHVLVWDGDFTGGSRYRTADESGLRVLRHNATVDPVQGEYFEVATPDGSRYILGNGPGDPGTDSEAVVPVRSNNTGEPTCGTTACERTYRWMLSKAVDPLGYETTYFYETEQNRYAVDGVAAKSAPYDAAIYPLRIEYGAILDDEGEHVHAEARVVFEYEFRCTEESDYYNPMIAEHLEKCDAPTGTESASYPDVPSDLICAVGNCTTAQNTPAFFKKQRLSQITTEVFVAPELEGTAVWTAVATMQLVTVFAMPTDGNPKSLWLDSVYTRSYDHTQATVAEPNAGALDTYAIKFIGAEFDNRVDYTVANPKTRQKKRRITEVVNELGGMIKVNYHTDHQVAGENTTHRHCPTAGAADTTYTTWYALVDWTKPHSDCYRVKTGSTTAVYHKYLVDSIELVDLDTNWDKQVFHYNYLGTPAWAYAGGGLNVIGYGDATWTDWRGYETVEVTTGLDLVKEEGQPDQWVVGPLTTTSRNQYYRGLDGNYLGNTDRQAASITRMTDGEVVVDHLALQGRLAASRTLDNLGRVVSESHTNYAVERVLDPELVEVVDLSGITVRDVLTPGDVSGNGHPDLLVWSSTGALTLYEGDGRGGVTLADGVTVNGGFGMYEHIIAPGDWNGDGKPDLFGVASNGRMYARAGTGPGTFAAHNSAVYSSGWGGSDFITPGDYNNDGHNDIIRRMTADGSLRIYTGNGAGGYIQTYVQIGNGWGIFEHVVGVGDWRTDGKVDLLGVYKTTGVTREYSGPGAVAYPSAQPEQSHGFTLTAYPQIAGPGDFDGDGRNDIIALNAAGELELFSGDGAGGFKPGRGKVIFGAATSGGGELALGGATSVRAKATVSTEFDPVTSDEVRTVTTTLTHTPEGQVKESKTEVSVDEEVMETTCTTQTYTWNLGEDSSSNPYGYFDAAGWNSGTYLVRPESTYSHRGECGTGTLTGQSHTYYDGSTDLENNTPELGLPTRETSLVEPAYDETAAKVVEANATYDEQGRIEEAWTRQVGESEPNERTKWVYGRDDMGLSSVNVKSVVVEEGQPDVILNQHTTWVEPRRGNVVKTTNVNGDRTYYEYDAMGMLTAGWAWDRFGEHVRDNPFDELQDPADPVDIDERTPFAAVAGLHANEIAPSVMFAYDVYAPGWGVRTKPVVVTSAQHVGFDGTEFYCEEAACFVNRSYTYLDGFGRVRQQHSVSPGGDGGRVIVATDYDERGNAWRTSSAMYDTQPAAVASGLLNPDYSSVESYSVTEFDWAGRALSEKLMSGDDEIRETTYAYEPSTTTTTSASDAISEVHTDVLGRMTSQVLHPESGYDLDAAHITTYEYEFLDADALVEYSLGDQLEGGTRVTVTDPEGNDTVFVSNLAGQRIHLTDPNSGKSTYFYDENGQIDEINSATGTIKMGYDILGRLETRTSTLPNSTVVSSSASWEYSKDSPHVGVLEKETATTVVGAGTLTAVALTTETTMNYGDDTNVLHRPLSSTTTLPTHPSLGDLSNHSYTRTFDYGDDPLGRARVTLPAVGGLLQETPITQYNRFGQAVSMEIIGVDGATTVTTPVVTGVVYDNIGRFVSRTYANTVTRSLTYDNVTGAVESLQASYVDDAELTKYIQHDDFEHDEVGRVTSIVDGVNRPSAVASELYGAQCFVYDDFNRLAAAWTEFTSDTESFTCESVAPATGETWWSEGPGGSSLAGAALGGTGHAGTAYATQWSYSDSGRITSISNLVADAALVKTFNYDESDAFHAVKGVESQTQIVVSDDFASNTYTGSSGWASGWVEAGDDGSASTGLVSVADAIITFTGVVSPGVNAVLARDLDVTDQVAAEVSVNVAHGVLDLDASDSFRVTVTNDADPVASVSEMITGDMVSAWDAGNPTTSTTPVSVDASSLLPATTLTVSLEVVSGVTGTDSVDVEQVHVTDVTVTLMDAPSSDLYGYDDAGRMISRTVGDVVTTFVWDVSSNLVSTTATVGVQPPVTTMYVYDAGGQRVARIGEESATAYFGDTEIEDPNTDELVEDDLTATRYYTFAGATVAMKDATGLKYLIGDIQGSATFTMLDARDSEGNPDWAESTITRNAYTPYGTIRGADNLTTDRGWLGQTEDHHTGLMYLNARYYDPTLGRFLSPDPLMDPGDPRTLDRYRYADNNPVMLKDASGLCSVHMNAKELEDCANASKNSGEILRKVKQQAYSDQAGIKRGWAEQVRRLNSPPELSMLVIGRMVALTSDWNSSPTADYIRTLDSSRLNYILREGLRPVMSLDFGALMRNYYRVGYGLLSSGPNDYTEEYMAVAGLFRYWRTGGPHDFKTYERAEFGMSYKVDLHLPGTESTVRADSLGNMQFGYMMASWGVDLENALGGSNSGGPAGKIDQLDDQSIVAGYELYSLHPDGLTTEDMLSYLQSDAYLKTVPLAAG